MLFLSSSDNDNEGNNDEDVVPPSIIQTSDDDGDTDDNDNDDNSSYDDWYADYDPSKFGSNNNKNYADGSDNLSYNAGGGSSGTGARHDYFRDTSRDASNVDLGRVNMLLSERLEYRKRGQFDRADAIRDALLEEHGVMVHDRTRTWRSGCSSSGSGRKWGTGGNNRNDNYNDNNNRGGRGRQQQRREAYGGGRGGRGGGGRRSWREMGPHGHDYELSSEAGPRTSPLSEDEIHAKLAERLECKLNRRFQQADAIQEELLKAGVTVHDGKKEWRADGKGFEDFTVRQYRQSSSSSSSSSSSWDNDDEDLELEESNVEQGGLSAAEREEIQELVDLRARFKAERIYDRADEIRDDLLDRFDVVIHDRLLQWSVGGDFDFDVDHDDRDDDSERNNNNRKTRSSFFTPYSLSPFSVEPPEEEDREEIQALVQERDAARAARDYVTADRIKLDLRSRGIYVDDQLRQWAVGRSPNACEGGGGGRQPQQRRAQQRFDDNEGRARGPRGWTRRSSSSSSSSSSLSKDDLEYIDAQLKLRDEYKRDRDYGKADRIRDALVKKYDVRLDDRTKQWHVVTDAYFVMESDGTASLDPAVRSVIEGRMAERALAKLRADYETADAIREELGEKYGVSINDRTKEWTIPLQRQQRAQAPQRRPKQQEEEVVVPVAEDYELDFPTDDDDDDDDDDNYSDAAEEEESVENSSSSSLHREEEEVHLNQPWVDDDDVDTYYQEEEEQEEEEEENNTTIVLTVEALNKLTVPQLKEKLRAIKKPVSGRKAELIERLLQ